MPFQTLRPPQRPIEAMLSQLLDWETPRSQKQVP